MRQRQAWKRIALATWLLAWAGACSSREGIRPSSYSPAACKDCDAAVTSDATPADDASEIDSSTDAGSFDARSDAAMDSGLADARTDAAPDAGRDASGPDSTIVIPPSEGVFVTAWDNGYGDADASLAIYEPTTGLATSLFLGVPGCCEYGIAPRPNELGVVTMNGNELWLARVAFASGAWTVLSTNSVLAGAAMSDGSALTAGAYRDPQIAWTGSRYLALFMSPNGIYARSVEETGSPTGPVTRVTTTTPGYELYAERRVDGEIGIAWADLATGFTAFFAVLDDTGAVKHGPTRIDETRAAQVRLVATGDGYVVSYVDENGLQMVRLGPDGVIRSRTNVAPACESGNDCSGSSGSPRLLYGGSSIEWNGHETMAVFTDRRLTTGLGRALYVNGIDSDGDVLYTTDIEVVARYPLYTDWPAIGWDGAHGKYGVTWNDVSTLGVSYAPVDASGVGPETDSAASGGAFGIRRYPRMWFVPTP